MKKMILKPYDNGIHIGLFYLYSRRTIDDSGEQILIGILGLQARSVSVDLTKDEWSVLQKETKRAAETLDDLRLQSEIYAALEGLLPQITITHLERRT